MKKKTYTGYKSFQYLEPGVDYRPFKLAKEVDRLTSPKVAVTAEEEAHVQRIFDENIAISLHDHAFIVPDDVTEIWEYRRQGRDWTAYEGLAVSGLDCIFDAFMDGTAMITSKAGWKWDDVIWDMGMRLSDIAHQDMVFLATKVEDIRRAKENGKIALVISLEAATMIENELDRIDILYGLGVRSLGIVYSEANNLGCGLREKNDGGLTQFGRAAVRRMNQLGIAIDISHAGDQTSLDTIEVSEDPIFVTHAGARALWDTNRLKPDHILKAVADKGGVIGIEAAPHTTLTPENRLHSIEPFMQHLEYIANLVGIDHVALGPDTLFGDHVGLHHAFAAQLSIKAAHGNQNFQEVEYVAGLENPGEAFPNIVRWMVKHGYSDQDMAKIIGENVLKMLERVW